MSKKAIAHVRKSDKVEQALSTHLIESSYISGLLADKLHLKQAGEVLGLMHDFGKYSSKFQKYIHDVTGISNPDLDEEENALNGNKVDHSTAGAQWVYRHLEQMGSHGSGILCGQILGLCIASHHGAGLIDCLSPEGKMVWKNRFDKADDLTHLQECIQKADKEILEKAESLVTASLLQELLHPIKQILKDSQTNHQIKEFYLGCYTRFLFSCLIDADRINSADFEHQYYAKERHFQDTVNWQEAIDKLEIYLKNFKPRYEIDHIRRDISQRCLERAHDAQDIYTLTVPTGGGKTLASLRYALHHAQKHQLDRIIYIIPYTSIIDQNADDVRKILGENWVLEHHSNLDPEQQTWQNKLLSANWDKPIVFTTMVQFLDAWFGGGTRGARHIHPMTKSVLIFDEIQTLPVKCVHLFCNILNWLVQYGKSTAILCTATQPLLDKLPSEIQKYGELCLSEHAELMGDPQSLKRLFTQLSRVQVKWENKQGGWSVNEAGAFLLQQFEQFSSCLFVVNTKCWAYDLYRYCQNQAVPQEALFHLSTHQCAMHRKALLEKIRERLKQKLPVLCISTQLIEAGVDISVQCVIRALAGLDSIAQAAGRCNRHGELEKGFVYVLNLQEPDFSKILPEIKLGQDKASETIRLYPNYDILHPETIQEYFKRYFYNRKDEMTYRIKKSDSGNLLDWLSDNSRNVFSEKNNWRRQNRQFPLLMQSFKSAGQAFKVIDAPTQALIVPYGEGKDLIAKLCGEYDAQEFNQYLAKAQRYSVNVFPHIFEKLMKSNGLQEISDTGIFYLHEQFYHDEYGLSFDEEGSMSFLYID